MRSERCVLVSLLWCALATGDRASAWQNRTPAPSSSVTAPSAAAPAAPAPVAGLVPHGVAPAEPVPALARLIGQYGTPEAPLIVYEAQGRLFVAGKGLRHIRLRAVANGRFVSDGGGGALPKVVLDFAGVSSQPAVSIRLNGSWLPRRDFGAEVVRMIRVGMRADRTALRAAALRATPPAEPAPARDDDLVGLAAVDASLRFDIRYATSNNFMGFPLYDRPGAYLQRPAAEALGRVARTLAPLGYGLLIYDAYRPWFVTKMFWDATPEAAHVFVADPAAGSRHNRGCAVDLTLYELATGTVVAMPGRYDEMSSRSFADYIGGTSRERWMRDLLRRAMEQQGFSVYPQEWWHFDYQDWHDYGIGTVTFERLERAALPG